MPKFAANLTMLFQEVEFLDRFSLAAKAGFQGVEYLFPYAWSAAELKVRLTEHSLQQVLFNLPPGDWNAGERGIACLPDRTDEFKQGVEKAAEYAQELGCTQLNCLAGLKPDSVSEELAWQTMLDNVSWAADQLSQHGLRLLVEAINSKVDMPGFFMDQSSKVLSLLSESTRKNVGLQYDVYHMQIMEGDLARTLKNNLSMIHHIQIADNPGRGEPGTGEINYPWLFKYLDQIGYQGWVSAEYLPTTDTESSLHWLQTAYHILNKF